MTSFASAGDQRNTNVVLSADISGYAAPMTQAQASTNALIGSVDALIGKMGQLKQATQGALGGFSRDVGVGLAGATGLAATYQKQLSTLNATAAITDQSMKGVKRSIENTFTSLPVSRSQVIELTETLEQLGVKGTTSLQKLTQTYEKLGAITGEGPAQLASGLEQLNRTFGGVGAEQSAKFANSLVTVSTSAGVAATSVLDFAQDIGPLAKQAGVAESAVLGISAAFVRAGQDGRVASQAFNTIMYDMTRLIQTGSPEIAKYANLVGVTTQAFEKMSGTMRASSILTALGSQGDQAARTLENWGMEGVRTQAAFAGVLQSGNANQLISQALGASTNTNNLDKGAKAAFNNVADGLALLRNQFTQMGTAIGTTFLTPLGKALQGVNALVGGLRAAVSAMAPVIGVLGVGAGAFGGIAAAAMHAAGVIGAVALGRYALRSTGSASFGLGRAMQRGTPVDQMTPAQQRAAAARDAGSMNRMQTFMMNRGVDSQAAVERTFGTGGTGFTGVKQAFRMGAIAPARAASWLFRDSRNFLNDSMRNDFQRRGLSYDTAGGPGAVYRNLQASANRGFGAIPREYAGAVGQGVRYYGAIARTGVQLAGRAVGGAVQALGGQSPVLAAQTAYAKSMLASAEATGATSKAEIGLAAKLRAYGLATEAATKSTLRNAAVVGVRGGAAVAGGTLAGAGKIAGGIGSALFSLPGMIALTAGTTIYSRMKDKQDAQRQRAEEPDFSQPIKDYNDELGIATNSVGLFAKSVDGAADQLTLLLGGVTATTSMSTVKQNTDIDVQNSKGQKVTDQKLKALASAGGKKDSVALGQLALSYGFTDPRAVQLFKEQANAAGFDQQTVTAALSMLPNQLTSTATPARNSYSGLTNRIAGTEGKVTGALSFLGPVNDISTTSSKGKELAATVIGPQGSINSQYGANATNFGPAYAAQKRFVDQMDFFASWAKDLKPQTNDASESAKIKHQALAEQITSTFGGNTGDVTNSIKKMNFAGMTQAQIEQSLLPILSKLPGFTKGVSTDPTQYNNVLKSLANTGMNDAETVHLRQSGILGYRETQPNSAVKTALAEPADMTKYYKALDDMATHSGAAGKSFIDVADKIERFGDATHDTTSQLYQLTQAAVAEQNARQAYVTPTESRAQQAADAGQSFHLARQRAVAPDASDAEKAAVRPTGDAYKAFHDQFEQQRQYEIQTYKMAQDYGIQMERANEDWQHNVKISNRDFHTQMVQSQQDFNTSTQRNQEDFNISMQRQAESAAQSIYDPFSRVEAKFTIDAATLLQNLADQNRRIAQQQADLVRLRNLGLSQSAIDTLQLADPNNAQQTDVLLQSLLNNPALIAQINAQVATRVQGTTALTQSAFSLSFREAVADFEKSSARAVLDFNRSRDRAVTAHNLAMDDMAYNFHLMVSRSGADLARSMEELTGDFADMFPKTMDMITKGLGKYAPEAAKILLDQMNQIKAAYEAGIGADLAAVSAPTGSAAADKNNSGGSAQVAYSQNDVALLESVAETWRKDGHDWNWIASKLPGIPVSEFTAIQTLYKSKHGGKLKTGGITLNEGDYRVSEGGMAEMHIPLNQQGEAWMQGMYRSISKGLQQEMAVSGKFVRPTGMGDSGTVTTYDYRTEISGPVTVQASSPKQMFDALDAKARLDKLTHPNKAAGSS